MPCGHFSLRSLIPATPSIDSGKAVMSVFPVRSWSAGDARSSSTTTDTIVIGTGRAITQVTSTAPEAAALLGRGAPVEPRQR